MAGIDWRGLFSEIRRDWKDKGANCSKGNVNICCPWCRNDPSYHLGVSEGRPAFYCYREPNKHSGKNLNWLLHALGQSREEADRLLRRYGGASNYKPEPVAPPPLPSAMMRQWDRFEPATSFDFALEYLRGRGFPHAGDAVSRYDLRIAPVGKWAGRLLIPYYTVSGDILGWTGRALSRQREPRYLTYVPGASVPPLITTVRPRARILVAVEGPLDALKVDFASSLDPRGEDFVTTGLSGKQLTATKIKLIQDFAPNAQGLLMALDSDVMAHAANQQMQELASMMRMHYAARARLPAGSKDPADIQFGDIMPWLLHCAKPLMVR